jgi:hypothetical protein
MPKETESRSSDTSRTTAETKRQTEKHKTSKTNTNKGKGTRKNSTEPNTRTNKTKQDKHARNSLTPRNTNHYHYRDLDSSTNYRSTIECRSRW